MPLPEKTTQSCSPVLLGVCGVATLTKTPQSLVVMVSQCSWFLEVVGFKELHGHPFCSLTFFGEELH